MTQASTSRPVVWREQARGDLAEIVTYIADRNPTAARRLKARIEDSVIPLQQHPLLFRKGRIEGTREIVAHPNYIVVYRVLESHVEIINVIHARREYP
jgi:toxin ParE1/3/4